MNRFMTVTEPDGDSELARSAVGPEHPAHVGHRHGPACSHLPLQTGDAGSGRWVVLLGTISGVVCLVHCLALPVLLGAVALLPTVGSRLHGPIELVLVGVTLTMAWTSVGLSFRFHRRRHPLLLLLIGTALSVAARVAPHETSSAASYVGIAGTGLLVASIWVNRAILGRGAHPAHVASGTAALAMPAEGLPVSPETLPIPPG